MIIQAVAARKILFTNYLKINMRVCIALFGLNRSLPWTQKSIYDNLISPLKQYGAQVKLYGHFNIPDSIHNPRSGEVVKSFKNRGMHLLPFDHVTTSLQAEGETSVLLEKFKQHDMLSNDPTVNSHRNLINQYRSLHAVMQMLQEIEGNDVDAVLFARPDLEYLDKLVVSEVLPKIFEGQFDLLTPTWHRWGGLNDRICLCSLRAAKIYANRIFLLDEVIKNNTPLNAEQILMYAIQKNFLKNGDLPLRGVRVRATGYTVDEGFDIDFYTNIKFLKRRIINKIRGVLT